MRRRSRGDGRDQILLSAPGSRVSIMPDNVENLTFLGGGRLDLGAEASDNVIISGALADTMNGGGGGGADILHGGDGADVLSSGSAWPPTQPLPCHPLPGTRCRSMM